MDAFDLTDLMATQQVGGWPYHEYPHKEWLSVGLYVRPARGTDGHRPHAKYEVYSVVTGRARFRADEDDRPFTDCILVVCKGQHIPT